MTARAVHQGETSVEATNSRLINMHDETQAADTALDRRPDSAMACGEELDTMVLNLLAIEAYLHRYTPLQRDRMMPYVRGLAAYEAFRPGAPLQAEDIDLGRRAIPTRLQGVIARERRAALAEARNIHQHHLQCLGDCTGAHHD